MTAPAGVLAGRVALITGGGAGIGRATAQLFAEEGAAVVVADLASSGEQTAADINDAGGAATFVRTDVSVEADVAAAVHVAVSTYGHLDAAFNNAGIGYPRMATEELDAADWDRMISINLRGVWLCLKHELAVMAPAKRGTIVNTASVAGVVGTGGLSPYTAAKHGVVGLTRDTAVEHGVNGIRVNALAPGLTNTYMVQDMVDDPNLDMEEVLAIAPLGRMAEPREMAEAVLWLTSAKSSFVTGHVLVVDGGYTAQ